MVMGRPLKEDQATDTTVNVTLIVAAEAVCGITCPLREWEQQLRTLAGDTAYQGDFIADWVHRLMFFDFQPSVFTLCYVLFGLIVLATFALAPPRWRREPRVS